MPTLGGSITVWLCVNTGAACERESASIKCVNYRAHQHKGANKRRLMIAQLSAEPSPSTFYLVVKCAIKGMVIGCERISFSLMHCHGAPGTSLLTHLVCDKFRCCLEILRHGKKSLWNHNMSKHEKKLKLFFSQPMYTDYSQIFSSSWSTSGQCTQKNLLKNKHCSRSHYCSGYMLRTTAGLTELRRARQKD